MSIFEQLTQAASDYDILWGAFRANLQAAADVTSATAARLADERTRADERTATLIYQSRDPARPEIVRKLAAQELDRLQERTFSPSADEAAAFSEALKNAQAALRDVVKVHAQLRDLFSAAHRELDTLRAGSLGNLSLDVDLAERHLEGERKSFDCLGHTGRPGGTP